MNADKGTPLAPLTTLRVGGPARRLVEAATEEEILAVVREADNAREPLLTLAGGSNVLIADEGFGGTVVLVRTRGIAETELEDGRVELRVAAGEPWDDVVAHAVRRGMAGIECLSGIPGSTGATPIQNVGAYGQEVAETIMGVRAFDRERDEPVDLTPADCGFAYRDSALKRSDRWVVLEVVFALTPGPASGKLRYGELARTLGVQAGEGAALAAVRDAVLELRASKGMVLDPDDPDTYSAGSFFTNPILDVREFAELTERARQRGTPGPPPAFPEADKRIKTSAAWLIENAGFHRGYGEGRAQLSTKHTLAITNRGRATTAELVALARDLRDGVLSAFGVELFPEPVFVGHRW